MKSKIIVLKAKISYMLKMIMKLWYIINHNGTNNNECYYEDMIKLEDDIEWIYKQASLSENEYHDYMLHKLGFDPFNESV